MIAYGRGGALETMAEGFSAERFSREIRRTVEQQWEAFTQSSR